MDVGRSVPRRYVLVLDGTDGGSAARACNSIVRGRQGKGVESFTASEGALLDPLRHEVVEDLGEDAEKGGTIQSCVQEGLQVGGAVVRKARVSAFSAPAPEEPAAEEEAAAEAEAAGEGDADAEEAA